MTLSLLSFLRVGASFSGLVAQAATKATWKGHDAVSWSAFLDQVAAAAQGQFRAVWDQQSYVRRIATLAERLQIADPLIARSLGRSRRAHPLRVPEFQDLERRISFQVTLISFEPGEAVPLHDHPDMTGVMTCAVGSASVDSYQLLSQDVAKNSFVLKREGVTWLQPRTVSYLTANKNNIHKVSAASFTQLIDIFTPPYDTRRTAATRWFAVEESSVTRNSQIVMAHAR